MAKLTDFELEAERKYAEKLAAREKKFEEREKERLRKYYIRNLVDDLVENREPEEWLLKEINNDGFDFDELLSAAEPIAKIERAYRIRKEEISDILLSDLEKCQAFVSGEDKLGCDSAEYERILSDLKEGEFAYEYERAIFHIVEDNQPSEILQNLAIVLGKSQEEVSKDIESQKKELEEKNLKEELKRKEEEQRRLELQARKDKRKEIINKTLSLLKKLFFGR